MAMYWMLSTIYFSSSHGTLKIDPGRRFKLTDRFSRGQRGGKILLVSVLFRCYYL